MKSESDLTSRLCLNRLPAIGLCAFFLLVMAICYAKTESYRYVIGKIKSKLGEALVYINPAPAGTFLDAVYVLGGHQKSLEYKFRVLSNLYKSGVARSFMILKEPGITEYSPLLERNLTNDEWAYSKLQELGVPKELVESVDNEEKFFGTLSEVESIFSLVITRGYKTIALISSPYHTRRVKVSFDHYLGDQDVNLFVYGSGESATLITLLTEFIKLKLYQLIL